MLRDDRSTLLGPDRFEGTPAPAREADPVDHQETPARDPLDPMGLIVPEAETAGHDLAHLGLVKGRKERNDLAVLGLGRFFPGHRKWFGI